MPILVTEPTPAPVNLPELPYTEATYAQLPEYVREADDGTVHDLLYAGCAQSDVAYTMLVDPSTYTDPATVPSARIDWLAALAGIDLTAVPQGERRAFIASDTSRYRGSPAAIRQRVGLTLTGAKQVEIEFTSQFAVTVTTYATQTPDEAATEAAIRAEVPAWLVLTAVTDAAGQSYTALAVDYPTYGDMTTTGKTYGTLSQET